MLQLWTVTTGDHAHLLYPSLFVFHNVRIPYFCNELHLYEHSTRWWQCNKICFLANSHACPTRKQRRLSPWRAQILSLLQNL
jgi:hypothetical protein